MNSDSIKQTLQAIIDRGILNADDFWLSNKSALVYYGISDDDLEYVSINCKRNVFDKLSKQGRFFERKKGKTRIMQLSSSVVLYEDNRPCKFCIKNGIKVETIYSILSKKLFYGEGKNLKEELEFLQKYIREHEANGE